MIFLMASSDRHSGLITTCHHGNEHGTMRQFIFCNCVLKKVTSVNTIPQVHVTYHLFPCPVCRHQIGLCTYALVVDLAVRCCIKPVLKCCSQKLMVKNLMRIACTKFICLRHPLWGHTRWMQAFVTNVVDLPWAVPILYSIDHYIELCIVLP